MIDLVINNYCNQRCDYCFAEDVLTTGGAKQCTSNMTVDTVRRILQFALRGDQRFHNVGVVGGEPTIHPEFESILQELSVYLSENRASATLFTNGTGLEPYVKSIPESMGMLVNVNAPEKVGDLFDKTVLALEEVARRDLFGKTTLGCNVYPTLLDYSWIWDLCKEFKLDHLRCSVVSPGGCFEHLHKERDYYYWKMKPIFLDFCQQAIQHGVHLGMDCGRIPDCYLSERELDLVRQATDGRPLQFCEPHIDINADLEVSSCLIMAGEQNSVKMTDFDTPEEIQRYLLANYTIPKWKKTAYGKCAACEKHKFMKCQGGCLGFTSEGG